MKADSGESRSIFRNLSPLDHRYYLENREPFDRLADYLSEEAVVRSYARVEIALLRQLVRMVPDAVRPGPGGAEELHVVDAMRAN